MTVPSLTADTISATLFFILTMYGSIMGGSGEVRITERIDLNQAIGGASGEKNAEDKENTNPNPAKNNPMKDELL